MAESDQEDTCRSVRICSCDNHHSGRLALGRPRTVGGLHRSTTDPQINRGLDRRATSLFGTSCFWSALAIADSCKTDCLLFHRARSGDIRISHSVNSEVCGDGIGSTVVHPHAAQVDADWMVRMALRKIHFFQGATLHTPEVHEDLESGPRAKAAH
jgi:hypothetical protein